MRYLILCFSFFFATDLVAVQQDLPKAEAPSLKDPKEIIHLQLKSLDLLIAMNQKTLHTLTELKTAIGRYQAIQEIFLQNPKDREVLYRMARIAAKLQKDIQEASLTHAFDPEFMSELALFTKIYKKKELP